MKLEWALRIRTHEPPPHLIETSWKAPLATNLFNDPTIPNHTLPCWRRSLFWHCLHCSCGARHVSAVSPRVKSGSTAAGGWKSVWTMRPSAGALRWNVSCRSCTAVTVIRAVTVTLSMGSCMNVMVNHLCFSRTYCWSPRPEHGSPSRTGSFLSWGSSPIGSELRETSISWSPPRTLEGLRVPGRSPRKASMIQ